MGYNKRQFTKANDKKVLHKVRKHWVVISMALLMAIGGKAAASHVSAHADTTNNNANLTNRISNNINQSKSTLTNVKAGNVQNNNASQSKVNTNQLNSASANNISKQANVLHQRILQNANNNVQNTSTNQQKTNTPKVGATKVNAPKSAVSTVAPKVANLGAVQQVNEPETGLADGESHYVRYYLDASDGYRDVDQESDSMNQNTPMTGFMHNWTKDLPGGYELDTSATANASDGGGATQNGVVADGSLAKTSAAINSAQPGENWIDIYIKKIPKKAMGKIGYIFKDVSDGNVIIPGGRTLSNYSSDKESAGNFNTLIHSVPFGYDFNNIISDGGLNFNFDSQGNAQNDVNFPTNATKNVIVGIHPKSTSANTETINYLDQSDSSNVISSRAINGTKNQPLDVVGDIDKYVPDGYDFVRNDFNGTPNFVKNGSLNVEVKPNGISPVSPMAPKGKGYVTLNYVSDGGTNVMSRTVTGNLGDTFDRDLYTGGNDLPYGYTFNNSGSRNILTDDNNGVPTAGASNIVSNFKSTPQAIDVDVSKIAGKSAETATASVQYLDAKTGSDISLPITIDAGAKTHAGDPINYSQYINFVPQDTTFAGWGDHNSVIEPNEINYIYLNKVNTTPGTITVHYYNQHGYNVSNYPINDANYGKNINVTDYINKSGTEKKTVPSDYTVDPNENVTYRVDSDAQNVNVLVTGNTNVSRKFYVVPVEKRAGQPNKTLSAYSDTITGNAGDSKTINLNSHKPNGYVVDPADNASVIIAPKGKIAQQSGDSTPNIINNNKITEYFDEVAPVTVTYKDQYGNTVGSANKISANDGSTVDITKQTDQTKTAIPAGYVPLPGQTTNYKVTTNPLNISFLVEGQKVGNNASYTVHRMKYMYESPNGSFNNVKVPINSDMRVGDSITIDPNSSTFKPAGFQPISEDGSQTTAKSYKITYNNETHQVSLEGNPFTLYYNTDDPTVANPKPINVVYENQSGDVINNGRHQLTGGYGDSVTVDDPGNGGYLPSNVSPVSAGASFSTPYEINKNQSDSMIDSFGKSDQTVIVHVHGRTQSGINYNVQPIYNKDGKATKGAIVPKTYDGEIGDHISIDPQNFNSNKSEYNPTYSDATGYLTVNSDGQAIPSSVINGSNQVVNNTSKSQGALAENYGVKQSTITVQYMNGSSDVHSDTILGNDSDSFDQSKYTTPKGMPSGYALNGVPDKTITKFTANNQTVQIPVKQQDSTLIRYMNGSNVINEVNAAGAPDDSIPITERYLKNVPSGYDVVNPGNYADIPFSAHNGGTYDIQVKPNGKHSNVPSDNKEGWITVNYVNTKSPHSGYTKSDITNSITFSGNQGDSISQGYVIDGTNVLHAVPQGTSGATLDSDENTQNTVSDGFLPGKDQTETVLYSGTPSHNEVYDYIVYKDTATGQQVGAPIRLHEMAGDNIDYSSYEQNVPQDYSYDKTHPSSLESTVQSHPNKDTTPNVIWVTPEKSDITYGTVQLQYIIQGGAKDGQELASDTETGVTGQIFDPSIDESTVPSDSEGNHYVFAGNDGKAVKTYGDSPQTNPEVMKVFVKEDNILPVDNYTINYMDGDSTKGSVTVTGNYKDNFSIADYMSELPTNLNGKYNAVSSSLQGGGAVPTTFDGNNETINVQLQPLSD